MIKNLVLLTSILVTPAAYHCTQSGGIYSCGDYWHGGHVDTYVRIGPPAAPRPEFKHVTPPGFDASDDCTNPNVYCIKSDTQ